MVANMFFLDSEDVGIGGMYSPPLKKIKKNTISIAWKKQVQMGREFPPISTKQYPLNGQIR